MLGRLGPSGWMLPGIDGKAGPPLWGTPGGARTSPSGVGAGGGRSGAELPLGGNGGGVWNLLVEEVPGSMGGDPGGAPLGYEAPMAFDQGLGAPATAPGMACLGPIGKPGGGIMPKACGVIGGRAAC